MSSAPVFSKIPSPIIPVLSKQNINVITLDKIIGKGAYGTVYSCHDDTNQELAVKCVRTKDFGIPSLIEASIMSTIHHPYLTKALKIHATPDKLYIIQELAISDLKVYQSNHALSYDTQVRWIFEIAQGIACLHKYDIIHGDIKSSNILVYPDNNVKLTDFTLSTNVKWVNSYRPCTATHRPLEVWLGEKWDKSIDIWAFGCTIFEIIYNQNLFIAQDKNESINAILDWYRFLPNTKVNVNYRNVFHYSFCLPDSFDTSLPINNLIMSLLQPSRPIIESIMKNELFNNQPILPSMLINTPVNTVDNKLKDKFLAFTNNEIVINMSYDLYSRITGLNNEKLKMVTCVWICYKLVTRQNLSLSVLTCDLQEILQMERSICNYLSYRLIFLNSKVSIKDKTF